MRAHRDAELAGEVLRVFLCAVEPVLRRASAGAPADARSRPPEQGSCGGRVGGVTFVQHFGASLNAHLHYHTCLVNGVFSAEGTVEQESLALHFHEATALTEADVVAVQEVVRKRVLALFERRGLLTPEATADMGEWEHGGGFSLDASIRIGPNDRAGLERLLRYCARPP